MKKNKTPVYSREMLTILKQNTALTQFNKLKRMPKTNKTREVYLYE